VSGEVREEGGFMYVSRGVGTAHLPLRIAAPPEIAVLRLRAI
jgi:predicted MPP superfamily phosphohydrolase